MFQVNKQSSYPEAQVLQKEVPLTLSRLRFNEAMRSVCELPPFNRSVFCGAVTLTSEPQVTVKACTCASGACPQHVCRTEEVVKPPTLSRSSGTFIAKGPKTNKLARAQTSKPSKHAEDDANHSLSSSTTMSLRDSDATFQKWLTEKNHSKRLMEEQKLILEQTIAEERARKRELERKNFVHWLASKKAAEKNRAPTSTNEEQEDERNKQDKEKKQLECDLKFQLWRKRKEEEYLENKLKEQVEKIRVAEDKKKRIQMNAAAYEEWLKNSRNKPKPLPMNRGLDSLRASVSVSYVNPTPWEPNIVKPTTQ